MIRVEPGSTPGIGITITEHFFFDFFVFCAMFFFLLFARGIGRMQQRRWKFFSILLLQIYTWFWGLHTTYYIKSDKVDEEYGYTGGTYLIFPPSWPPLPTYLTIGTTETTSLVLTLPCLVGRYTCMSSSRSAVQCSAVQTGRFYPIVSHERTFLRHWPVQQLYIPL